MPLGPTQRELPGLKLPALWNELTALWERYLPGRGRPETGLCLNGRIGIKVHRDASYARPVCMIINLGQVLWFCDPDRNGRSNYPVPRDKCKALTGVSVITFDCKHPHGTIPTCPEGRRWSIVLWQVK